MRSDFFYAKTRDNWHDFRQCSTIIFNQFIMKKILTLFIFVVSVGTLIAQRNQARVENFQGLDVYVMNTPLAKYDVVVRMNSFSLANINVSTIATGGAIRETAADKLNKYVNQVLRQAEKDSVKVDAIIYSGGKGAVGIAYTDQENRGIAEVKQLYGMDVYAFCEPIKGYDMVNSKRARSGAMVAGSTYGVIDSSIDEDIEKLARRLKRKKKKYGTQGILYNIGNRGSGIVYQ